VVAPEQAFYLVNGAFGQLRDELLPVAVLDLQESHQIVRFEEHEADETPIQLLVALDFILELASDVPVELLFVHW